MFAFDGVTLVSQDLIFDESHTFKKKKNPNHDVMWV